MERLDLLWVFRAGCLDVAGGSVADHGVVLDTTGLFLARDPHGFSRGIAWSPQVEEMGQ